MLKSTLETVLKSQLERLQKKGKGLHRLDLSHISIPENLALIITGVRRGGKSTLLHQLLQSAGSGSYYLNFEDPRLYEFEKNDFSRLDSLLQELGCKTLFLDEIQQVPEWERYVRHLLDNDYRVVITGSNASLLSKELGTKLTGRHLSYELFPFSYAEFLQFTQAENNEKQLLKYLKLGGFPEYLKQNRTEILKLLLEDILLRDIAVRYALRDVKSLQRLGWYLLSNVGKLFTASRLMSLVELKSKSTLLEYLDYLEDAYLCFYVPKFDYSQRKQLVNPRKIYAIDTGIVQVNSVSLSEDIGRKLENLVFLALRRKYKNICYFSQQHECDFVVLENDQCKMLVQVCLEVNPDNQARETSGLLEAMTFFKHRHATIVTLNQNDQIESDGRTIQLVAAHQWIMGLEEGHKA